MIGGAATGTLFWGLNEIWEFIEQKVAFASLGWYVETEHCHWDPDSGHVTWSSGGTICGGFRRVNDTGDYNVPMFVGGTTTGWGNIIYSYGRLFPRSPQIPNQIRQAYDGQWQKTPKAAPMEAKYPSIADAYAAEGVKPMPTLPPAVVPPIAGGLDPFTVPPLTTFPGFFQLPVNFARGGLMFNPWRSPTEQSNGGYEVPPNAPGEPVRRKRDRPRIRPRPDLTEGVAQPDTVVPFDPVPGRPKPYASSSGSRRPPPGTRERKFALAVGGVPAQIISVVGESIDFIESFHDALPKHLQAKAPEGWWRGPSPQAMVEALWQNYDKIDFSEAFRNLVTNHYEDKFFGKLGRINAKASRKFGRPAGFQLGPAM